MSMYPCYRNLYKAALLPLLLPWSIPRTEALHGDLDLFASVNWDFSNMGFEKIGRFFGTAVLWPYRFLLWSSLDYSHLMLWCTLRSTASQRVSLLKQGEQSRKAEGCFWRRCWHLPDQEDWSCCVRSPVQGPRGWWGLCWTCHLLSTSWAQSCLMEQGVPLQ